MDTFDVAAAVAAQRRENARVDRLLARRRAQMIAEARRLAERIVAEDAAVTRILLFGSLLPGREFRESSDVDVAVEGAVRFGPLLRLAEDSPAPIDLVEWESVADPLKTVILADAEVLYEA